MTIQNCHNLTIRNTRFIGGNTNLLRKLPRHDIPYSGRKVNIFEIIDGGAVVITGNSTVHFENCDFLHNTSIMCGGAISNQSTGVVTFNRCVFEKNTAGHTGSAIDNLVEGSRLFIDHCIFRNNRSNTWNKHNGPHGQVSIFPKSHATIKNSTFKEGSTPFDFFSNATVQIHNNHYHGYRDWHETISPKRSSQIFEKILVGMKLHWILPKTIGHVYYHVPRPVT